MKQPETIPCKACKKAIPLDKNGLPSVPVSIRQRKNGQHLIFCSTFCEATDWTGGKIEAGRLWRNMAPGYSIECKPKTATAGKSPRSSL